MELTISTWLATQHLIKYHPSIRQFVDFYLPLISKDEKSITKHYIYLCPLCLEQYILYKDDIWSCSQEFTLDHFPPQNIGGSDTLLTCKACNNNAGSSYEPVLEEWLNMISFNQKMPNVEIKTKAVLSDKKGWYHGSMGIDEQGQFTHGLNPKQLKKFKLDDWHGKEGTMDITIKDPDKKKMTKALLKTAYLYCFSYWGYEFTYSQAGELIRKVLKDEAEYPIPVTEIYIDEKNTPAFDSISIGLAYMHTASEIHGMFVFIPFLLESNGYRTIIPVQIPNPTQKGMEEIKDFQDTFKKGSTLNIMVTPIINNLETFMCLPYSLSWIKIKQDLANGKYNTTH